MSVVGVQRQSRRRPPPIASQDRCGVGAAAREPEDAFVARARDDLERGEQDDVAQPQRARSVLPLDARGGTPLLRFVRIERALSGGNVLGQYRHAVLALLVADLVNDAERSEDVRPLLCLGAVRRPAHHTR